MYQPRRNSIPLIAAAAAVSAAGLLIAGPLNPPPGPVAPTYKTLSEVEPRIAINSANTPGDANSVFTITQPGSYYLTSNLPALPGRHGIKITSGGVTLDLNGFEIFGSEASLSGVYCLAAGGAQVSIRNGTIRNCGDFGVYCSVTGSLIEDIHATHNSTGGIFLSGSGIRVTRCAALQNGQYGIASSVSFSTVTDCIAEQNTGTGISLNDGTVTGCYVTENTGGGIAVNSRALVTACNLANNGGIGIQAGVGCKIQGCTVATSGSHGIEVASNDTVSECICISNGTAGIGAGIHLTGNGTRIDSCQMNSNDQGILCDLADNLITRNSARGNSVANFSFPAGSEYGEIIINPGNAFVATNAWANFAY